MTRTRVRAARPDDVPAVLALVRALAEYEREPDAVEATETDFREALFGADPRVHALVAEVLPGEGGPSDDAGSRPGAGPSDEAGTRPGVGRAAAPDGAADEPGEVVGLALWFVSFSTWRGRHGIWLEDLFVRPEHRGLGLGRALLAALAAECERRGYARLEWNVLDWNEPAQRFYRSLGAEALDQWTVHRLSGPPLAALAGGRPEPRA